MANKWLAFWQEKNAFDESMYINYRYFLNRIEKYVTLTAQTTVLDIGSGPGNLEDAWHARVKEIVGLDISERYNEIAKKKHTGHHNIFFYTLSDTDFTNLAVLGNKKFDVVIVMSVLQYYPGKEAVVQLLKNLSRHTMPGGKIFLCDLIIKESALKEITQVLYAAYKENKLFSTLGLFFKLRFSKYYKVKKEAGFLILSEKEWKEILNGLTLNGVFLKEPLTLQKSRQNILIQL